MRQYFVDNLRWLVVLFLFPFHTFMIYNSFGEGFYIRGVDIKATTTFIVVAWPWSMPLLFTVAGISTAYSLRRRSLGEYTKERVRKLLVPLLAGLLLVVPVQTYFAERFHNGYTGGYFAQYALFFTGPTDLTGYTGGFTPGHLWFILYLFVISLAAVPLILLARKIRYAPDVSRMRLPVVLCLFVLPALGSFVLDINGKSVVEYFVYFLLGYIVLSDENVQQKLEGHRFVLLGAGLVCLAGMILVWYDFFYLPWLCNGIFEYFYGWVTILALLGLGRRYFNTNNQITTYMSRASFSVYIFHMTWIVVAAFYVFQLTGSTPVRIALILSTSVAATFASYEVCRRISVTRFLFAIKK